MPAKRIFIRHITGLPRKTILLAVTLLVIALLPPTSVATVSLDLITPDKQDLLEGVSVYIDPTSKFDLSDILTKGNDFQQPVKPELSIPANTTSWFRFSLENLSSTEQERVLSIVNRGSIHNRLWIKKGNAWALIGEIDYRDWHKFPSKPSPTPYFLLDVPQGHTHFLLAVKNYTLRKTHLELWQTRAFFEQVYNDSTLYAFFVAITLAMALYNLALFKSMRDSMYLYYAGYIFFGSMFFPLRDQYYSIWFDTNLLMLFDLKGNHAPLLLVITTAMLMLALYAFRFLNLTFSDRWQKALKYTILACPFLLPFFEFAELLLPQSADTSQFLRTAGNTSVLCFGVLLLIVISYIAIAGPMQSRGRWLLATLGVALIGAIIETLRILGYLSDSFRFTLHIGVTIEIMVLSIYMQHRVNQLRRDKEHAQHALLESTTKEAERLDAIVKERTKELDLKLYELATSNATKDKFFSLLAHDLRGPIGNLSIMLDLARNKEILLDEQILNELYDSSHHTYNLLEDLLTWSRSHRGILEVKPRNFLASQTVSRAASVLCEQARQKSIELVFETDDATQGYADVSMVSTVVRNLVSNAIKFTPPHGRITISAENEDGEVRISVKDTGVGLSEKQSRNMFSLEQMGLSSPGTNQEKGTGMGLILCKEFVTINQGEIGFFSVVGRGSEFWFTIPKGKKPSIDSPETDLLEQGFVNWNELKTLLVEDNNLNIEAEQRVLAKLGIRPQIAMTGDEAIEAAQQRNFDLVLMDIHLPGIDGVETSRRIRQLNQGDTPIVALSSFTKSELAQSGKDIFDAYLEKPLMLPMLEAVLNELFTQTPRRHLA